MAVPSFMISNPAERLLGFLIFLALGWFVLLKPAWFGLKQAFGRVDPTAEAMAGVRAGLKTIFGDIKSLAQASVPDLVAMVALVALEDLIEGRARLISFWHKDRSGLEAHRTSIGVEGFDHDPYRFCPSTLTVPSPDRSSNLKNRKSH